MINKHPGFKAIADKINKQNSYKANPKVVKALRLICIKKQFSNKNKTRLKRVNNFMNKTTILNNHKIIIDNYIYKELLIKAIAFDRMKVVGANFKIEVPNISNMYPDLVNKTEEELIEEYQGI